MSLKCASVLWAVLFTAAFAIGFAGSSWANHKWYCWKYADKNIYFYNGAASPYNGYFSQEGLTDSNSWHNYTNLNLTSVGSAGSTDHVNCYSGNYGFNGWLGIAEILTYSGCTVKQGRCRLNNSYLASYGTTARKHVACQEVGHLFGLGHNHSSNVTCMNDWILSAPQPDSHDQALINSIYP